MHDFQDNEKKTIKNVRQLAFSYFLSAKVVMSYPCASPCILFYIHGRAILLCFFAILL